MSRSHSKDRRRQKRRFRERRLVGLQRAHRAGRLSADDYQRLLREGK